MSDTHELYQEIILEHSRDPHHFGTLSEATHSAEGNNPLCGDRYQFSLRVDEEGVIRDIAFEGAGCAISKASASMMSEAVLGRTCAEVDALFQRVQALIKGERDPEGDDLGELEVLSGIWQYPSRVKCAILCWHAVRSALTGGASVSTE